MAIELGVSRDFGSKIIWVNETHFVIFGSVGNEDQLYYARKNSALGWSYHHHHINRTVTFNKNIVNKIKIRIYEYIQHSKEIDLFSPEIEKTLDECLLHSPFLNQKEYLLFKLTEEL